MKIKILDQAEADLIEGFHFYETQPTGVGDYFLANLYADIESLRLYGGIHLKPYKNYHRIYSQSFRQVRRHGVCRSGKGVKTVA
jgi:hypothetical protein